MRHRQSNRKLNRTTSHRLAMLRNLANSLFLHEVIKTTLPKAKELRRVAEPLIAIAQRAVINYDAAIAADGSEAGLKKAREVLASRKRLVYDRTRDRDMVAKLFNDFAPRFANRNGGYTRVLKFGFRKGDNAPMALVELLDRPEVDTSALVEVEETA